MQLMKGRQTLRGFKILKSQRRDSLSIKLFAQNGSRYLVMITRYFLGFPLKRRYFTFEDLGQAEYYYSKVVLSKHI